MFVCIVAALQFKFMVKSVDPDYTTSATGRGDEPEDGVEEYEDDVGETTTSAPVTLGGEKDIRANQTGNDNCLNITHQYCCWTGSQPHGPNTQTPQM